MTDEETRDGSDVPESGDPGVRSRMPPTRRTPHRWARRTPTSRSTSGTTSTGSRLLSTRPAREVVDMGGVGASGYREVSSAAGGVRQALPDWLGQLQDASCERAGPAVRKAYPPQRRMTGSQLASYLQRRTYALASSTRPDGRAHAAPTLFTVYAGAFWLLTVRNAARIANVQTNPWLALSIV